MAERKNDRQERIQKFVENLKGLDSGDKAKLKRNAGKRLSDARHIGTFYRILPFGTPQYEEESFFLVATLYPLADSGSMKNFGYSLQRAKDSQNGKGMDRRIEVLIDSDETQLPFHLRQAVRLIHSKNVPVNWEQLLKDLIGWSHADKYVQKQWVRDYFID